MVDYRKEREKQLQDERFRVNDGDRGVDRIYAITGASHGTFKRRLHELARGKHVLEFGCGNGAHVLELCPHAESVTGIDISDVGIEIGRNNAQAAGITNAAFHVMDAEQLDFPADTFDVICGVGILHHLDLDRAYSELARTMSKDGVALFLEPLGYNPFINLYRRLTPHIRTPDEHPLLAADLELARKYFGKVDVTYYYLTTLLTVPVARTRIGRPAVGVANAMDRALFSVVPALRKYAWMVLIQLSSPLRA